MATLPKTPTTACATRQLAAEVYCDSIIFHRQYNPEQIRQLYQSTIINATLRQKTEKELHTLQAAVAARTQRQKPGKRVVQKGGVIYAYAAREAVDKHLEKEAEAAGKVVARQHLTEGKAVKRAQNQASNSQNL